jgi:DNA-directed RNA polymerase III subunit RPC6
MMASSSVDITALKMKLYDACAPLVAEDPTIIFNQAFIFDLGIIPNRDVNVLLKVTQALVNDKLFKILQSEGLAWRLRSQEEARQSVLPPSSSAHKLKL